VFSSVRLRLCRGNRFDFATSSTATAPVVPYRAPPERWNARVDLAGPPAASRHRIHRYDGSARERHDHRSCGPDQVHTLQAGMAGVSSIAKVSVCYMGVNGRDGSFRHSYQRGEAVDFPLTGVVAAPEGHRGTNGRVHGRRRNDLRGWLPDGQPALESGPATRSSSRSRSQRFELSVAAPLRKRPREIVDCDYIEFLRCPSCASIQSNSATSGRRRGMPDGAKEAIPLRRNSVFLQGGAISRRDAPTEWPFGCEARHRRALNYVDGCRAPTRSATQRLGAPPRRDACFRHAPISARISVSSGLGDKQLMELRARSPSCSDQVVAISGDHWAPLCRRSVAVREH